LQDRPRPPESLPELPISGESSAVESMTAAALTDGNSHKTAWMLQDVSAARAALMPRKLARL